ncbi:hypothetical protein ADEAN_000153000 [Angomonas deanei]|uniref:Uncharacterized protein n=1 Tax=Angomonas deanei TaxID=59799 RepID=A0A7G2C317_9TRYP|nr:hypothetical protein ADEAN_000153000 [Angomonas deanei]
MTYALGQDNVVVQRAGISTCASVIDFLKTTSDVGGRTDFEVEVLKSILRVVVQNGVPSANCGHIAGSLVSVCRDIADVNHGRIGASFQNLSESFPLRKKGLLHVYHHLWKAVNGDGRETMNDFEECLLDSFTETVAL